MKARALGVALALWGSAASAAVAHDAEGEVRRHIRMSFERRGRGSPAHDPVLDRAARQLATRAASGSAQGATAHAAISDAMSTAGAWDPSPRIVVLRGQTPEALLKSFRERSDLAAEPAAAFGAGVVSDGKTGAVSLVAVLTERKALLASFPRERKPGEKAELCGELLGGLHTPELFVTQPDGKVQRPALTRSEGRRFCGPVSFPRAGRYSVEILARGERGPEVAALFTVGAGKAVARAGDAPALPEPTSVRDARRALLGRINALRKAHGAGPVKLDDVLTDVAQEHSEEMAEKGYFAHVSPDGMSVGQRLKRAGYEFARAGENLGLAHAPLAAHEGIEQSPGHRKNLLEPDYTHVGIGVTFRNEEGGPRVYVTEVLAVPLATTGNPVEDAHLAVAALRTREKLAPLERNARLDGIARAYAEAVHASGDPSRRLGRDVHKEVFEALPDSRSAALDVFVSDSPSVVPKSKALLDARNRWLGVGIVKGDSARFGKNKYWVVMVYAGGEDD